SVLERRLAEGAQQRTPMVVRTEQMIGARIFVVLPPVSHLALESRHCLVGPCPVSKQARETIDRCLFQRSILWCLYSHHVSVRPRHVCTAATAVRYEGCSRAAQSSIRPWYRFRFTCGGTLAWLRADAKVSSIPSSDRSHSAGLVSYVEQ